MADRKQSRVPDRSKRRSARSVARKSAPRKSAGATSRRAARASRATTRPTPARAARKGGADGPRPEALRDIRVRVTTIGDLLLAAADEHAGSDALVFPGLRLSYGELAQRAIERARGLKALGVQPREHVGLLLHSCTEFVEYFFAIALCGAVVVPINARYKPHELGYVVENGDLVTIVTTGRIADQVNFVMRLDGALPGLTAARDPMRLALAAAPRLRNVLMLGRSAPKAFVSERRFRELAKTVPRDAVHRSRLGVRVRDVGLMLYTSGTTANPKGCLISHEAMVRNSIALGRYRYQLTSSDRFWSPLPLYHIAAILPMLATFDVGGAYLTMPHFDAGKALEMLADERATATYPSFVTIMSDLIYHPNFKKTDLSGIRLMNSNFAVQPPGIKEAMLAAMPNAVQVGSFGMTEAAGTVCTGMLTDTLESRVTRLGHPLPGLELRIVDPGTGADVRVGERGEVLVRGYSTLEGYYKDTEKTAQAIDTDGWYHTGDIGSLDARGTIMFHGRTRDMLKVGGENVAAAEIEACLQRHPAVKLAQVVGLPDARYVEVPAAFVELKPGRSAVEPELVEHCRREIAGFKVPRHVRFVSDWPMSTSKIQKFRLRDQLMQELHMV